MEIARAVYVLVAVAVLHFGVQGILAFALWSDLADAKVPARIILAAPVWPIVLLWFVIRWLWRTADLGKRARG